MNGGGVKQWYAKRYKRLLITYFMVSIPYYTIFCAVKGGSVLDFLLYVSTIGFWTCHQGQWFVDAIIPLYAISLVLFLFMQKSNHRAILAILLSFLCIGLSAIPNVSCEPYSTIWGNIQYVVGRVPSFIMGMAVAPLIKDGVIIKHPLFWVAGSVLIYLLLKLLPLNVASEPFATIPLLYIFIKVCKYQCASIQNIAFFMGNISLESYLFNVTLPFFIKMIPWDKASFNLGYGNYLPYLCVIVVGTLFSCCLNNFVKVINKK